MVGDDCTSGLGVGKCYDDSERVEGRPKELDRVTGVSHHGVRVCPGGYWIRKRRVRWDFYSRPTGEGSLRVSRPTHEVNLPFDGSHLWVVTSTPSPGFPLFYSEDPVTSRTRN